MTDKPIRRSAMLSAAPAEPDTGRSAATSVHAHTASDALTAEAAHDRQRRGTRQLLAARCISFVCAYVIAAILARTLGPADYGIYGVIVSQLLWLEMLVTAGIPAATSKLLADGRHDPQDVERSARAVILGVSLVVLCAGWALSPAVATMMRIPEGIMWFRIALLDLPFAALFASYEGILSGRRQFGAMALAHVGLGLTRVMAISTLLIIGFSISSALAALVAATLVIGLAMIARYPPHGFLSGRKTMSELARFAGPLALCLIAGQVLVSLDLWALQSLGTGGGEVVGQYVASLNLARTLAVIPTVQAGVLFSSVAWASASRDKARAVQHIQEASRFAIVTAVGASVLVGTNGSEVLALLFSSAYAEGQRFLPFQLAGFTLFALLDVFANALMAAGRHRIVAVVLSSALPLVWAANYFLIPVYGPTGAATSLVLGISVATLAIGIIAAVHFGSLMRSATLGRVLVAGALVALASAAVPVQGPSVLVKLAALGVLYLSILYGLNEITLEDLGLHRRNVGRSRTTADGQRFE